MRRAGAIVLASLMLSGGVPGAMSVRPMSLSELATGSSRIVLGTVQSMTSTWDSAGAKIFTLVTILPQETWKGVAPTPVTVRVPGGTVGGITMHCGEAPSFTQGETVVAFLRPNAGMDEVYGWFRGKYSVLAGSIREIPNTTVAAFRSTVLGLVEKGR